MALPEHWADDWRLWVPDHRAWEAAFVDFQGEYFAGNTKILFKVKKWNPIFCHLNIQIPGCFPELVGLASGRHVQRWP